MEKKRSVWVIILIVFIALLLLGGLAVVAYNLFIKDDGETGDIAANEFIELANKYDELSYDKDRGFAYVNNRVIVLLKEGATAENAAKLADTYFCTVTEAMEEEGIYCFTLNERVDYDYLEALTEELEKEKKVENAFTDVVLLVSDDTDDVQAELEEKPAVYPDDPWREGEGYEPWNSDNPAGNNWGVEAIRAPEAWGYLDSVQSVNIGIIDTMIELSHDDIDVKSSKLAYTDKDTKITTINEVDNSTVSAGEHGTHVAGIMAATWNKEGISGVSGGKAELYYSSAYNSSGNRTIDEFTTGYNYFRAVKILIDQDVQAINISQNSNRLIGFAASKGNQKAKNYLKDQANKFSHYMERTVNTRIKAGKPDFVICVAAGNNNSLVYHEDENATYGYSAGSAAFKESLSGGALAKYNNIINLVDAEAVKSRVIVVGSVKLNGNSDQGARFAYSAFSNIGDRVDIVAPGENIYSLGLNNTYKKLSGTSMATPHVTAAAGLLFGANPSLSGPDVKRLLTGTVAGRYYYEGGYSGLLDLEAAIRAALLTADHTVSQVVATASAGLDLCFVIDTTGSMGDDIDDAKASMESILAKLSEKTEDYRVAIIDYRDYSDRGSSEDYPCKVQLDFSNDKNAIISAINDIDLGNGGDFEETVYSGLMRALELDWRNSSKKIIIVLGDAPPLDPEPYTNYTYEEVVLSLYSADIVIDRDNSDKRVLGEAENSLINVYTINTGDSADVEDMFGKISEETGGAYMNVEDSSQVSDAIIESIDKVELSGRACVTDFGSDYSNETVDLYIDDGYYFSYPLDETGRFTLSAMESGEYEWCIERLNAKGMLEVRSDRRFANISFGKTPWYNFAVVLWQRHPVATVGIAVAAVAVILVSVIGISVVRKKAKEEEKLKEMEEIVLSSPDETDAADTAVEVQIKTEIIEAQPKEQIKTCPGCGEKITGDKKFCGKCGTKL